MLMAVIFFSILGHSGSGSFDQNNLRTNFSGVSGSSIPTPENHENSGTNQSGLDVDFVIDLVAGFVVDFPTFRVPVGYVFYENDADGYSAQFFFRLGK